MVMAARFPLVLALLLIAATAEAQTPPGDERYQVVINHEEQYSVWLADREPPRGWEATGRSGTLVQVRAYIEEVWTDMRPLSLRTRMEEAGMPRDKGRYQVVVNHEEQYSLVLASAEVRRPWKVVGEVCRYEACLAYIEEVWTDMRPLSLRRRLNDG